MFGVTSRCFLCLSLLLVLALIASAGKTGKYYGQSGQYHHDAHLHPVGNSNLLLRCTRRDDTEYMVCHKREDQVPDHCIVERRGC